MHRIIAAVSDSPALKADSLKRRIDLTEDLNREVVDIKGMAKFIGKGIFAKKAFKAGELVVIGIQTEPAEKSIHSITGPDGNEYIYNHIAETINHHCNPNTGPLQVGDSWSFFARRGIEATEEITWAYDWTEPVIGHFNGDGDKGGQCLCSSADCRTPLKGFNTLNPTQVEAIQRQKEELKVAVAAYSRTAI